MTQLTPLDELLAHQLPEPIANVATHHPHWRESYFFVAHRPDALGDMIILTMATYPHREQVDSLQMGRVGGTRILGVQTRDFDGDPHTAVAGGARVDIVRPFEEMRLFADPDVCALGIDLTFRARTAAYGLRRGTMRAGHELVWDQSHMLQSGVYNGSYTVDGVTHEVRDWWGQRDHSWGIRDHGRCPLWMWFQIQLPDGFIGVWHWEYANGARVYTDGCWAPADGGAPVPIVDFHTDVEWLDAHGAPAVYGQHGETVEGLRGTSTFVFEGGRTVVVHADGSFDRPYEPFQRGGLSQMRVSTDDGREGTAIYEVTGSHHHRWFPDAHTQRPASFVSDELVTVYWRPGCGFCSRLFRGLQHEGVEFREVNIWDDPEAAAFVRSVARGNETVPTVTVRDIALVNPPAAQVAELVRTALA